MSLKSIVTFGNFIWETGKQLLDVEVSLGSADKSSSCKVTLADPMHTIAAACINHSQSLGGIQALPDVNKQPVFNPPGAKSEGSPVTSVPPGNGTVATGTGFTPEVKAFLDTVAKRETSSPNTLVGYYQNNNVNNNVGQFNDTDVAAGGGYPKSAGTSYNVGRYQFNRGDWSEAKGKNPAITGFTPLDQDLVAYSKIMKEGRGGKQLLAGDIVAALTKAGDEWASIPYISPDRKRNSIKQIQPGTTKQEYLDYYALRLAFHKGGSGVAAAKVAPIAKPAAPAATDTATPVIKGSVIVIQIAGIYYEFMHQGTELNESGVTILIGQGVRWLMSRRKRSATYKDLTLQQLAEKVGKEHKVKVDYQAVSNPAYSHIDQSGISDYQMLQRECTENGLLMTEVKGTLVIKERKQLSDSKLVLARGLNLISYKIADRAVGTHDDEISKLLPQTAKTTIDPIAGKTQTIIKDVDRNATANKPTGVSKPATAGTLKDGKAVQVKEKAATKRIAGLPSTFVIPLTVANLTVEPIMTLHTTGLPGVLGNRLWVIKKITHKLADNTTTLDVVSPVEVLDLNPAFTPPGAKKEGSAASTAKGITGDINDRIYQSALLCKDLPTGDSNVPKRVACAWAVNRLVLYKAGIGQIGVVQDRVDSVRLAMVTGRGKEIARGQEIPGDVLIMGSGDKAHIGIFMGTNITLSNSSSKGTFSWTTTYEDYVKIYGSGTYYRVLR